MIRHAHSIHFTDQVAYVFDFGAVFIGFGACFNSILEPLFGSWKVSVIHYCLSLSQVMLGKITLHLNSNLCRTNTSLPNSTITIFPTIKPLSTKFNLSRSDIP